MATFVKHEVVEANRTKPLILQWMFNVDDSVQQDTPLTVVLTAVDDANRENVKNSTPVYSKFLTVQHAIMHVYRYLLASLESRQMSEVKGHLQMCI